MTERDQRLETRDQRPTSHEAGRRARERQEPLIDNPYTDPDDYTAWSEGWHERHWELWEIEQDDRPLTDNSPT